MPFDFIPDFQGNVIEILMHIFALIGIFFLAYSVFLEQVHRKDLVMLLGSFCLLCFALYKEQTVFIVAMSAVCLASIVEFAEIMLGMHKHAPDDLKKYKKMWRTKKHS